MKKSSSFFSFGFLAGLAAAALIFALMGKEEKAQGSAVRELKVAHALPATHPVHAGMVFMSKRMSEISGGKMKIDIFPNGQLGSETQTIEQLQSGTLDIAKISAAPLGNFISLLKVFSLPYLFRDEEHFWAVLDGEVGQTLLEKITINDNSQSSGLRGLTYYDSGSRNFYGKQAFLSPSDLKGVKIRVMNDPVAMDMVSALSGSPTPVPWGELYTALQQGVVNGAENNPPSFVASRHFEVCKHFSLDHHSRIPDMLVVSGQTWSSLNEQEQAWLMQAAAESSVFQRDAWAKAVEESLEIMRNEGVHLYDVEMKSFVEATSIVREKYGTGAIEKLMNRIQAVE